MDTLEPVVDERSDSSGPDSPIEEVETGPDAERKKPRTKRIAVVSMFVFLLMLFNIGLYLNRTYFFEKEKELLRIDTVFPKERLLRPKPFRIRQSFLPMKIPPRLWVKQRWKIRKLNPKPFRLKSLPVSRSSREAA